MIPRGSAAGKFIELPSLEVIAIFIAADAGLPMRGVTFANALAGLGLEGERYASRTGYFSGKRIPDEDRQVTLISRDGIDEANQKLVEQGNKPFTWDETRRNLIVEIDPDELNGLVGKQFTIDGVLLEGSALCTPCNRPATVLVGSGKKKFEVGFENRGGLRARILRGGKIRARS